MNARHEWWSPAASLLLVVMALSLSGCVPAPEATGAPPDAPAAAHGVPEVAVVRRFGPVACWRIEVPDVSATPEAWPSLCIPVAVARPCIETPAKLHCPDAPPPPRDPGVWQ